MAAESAARKEKRAELRILWNQRKMTSTAMLPPEQAAAVDLIKQREAKIEELEQAIAVMEAGNEKLGIRSPQRPRIPNAPTVSITALFDDYAASGAAVPHTVAKWRAAVVAFVKHLDHDDAAAVTRADFSGWLKALVASGLSTRTVRGTYRAAVARVFKIAFDDGRVAQNVAAAMEVRGPKRVKTKRDDISDDEAKAILSAALEPQGSNIGEHVALARRWVPWICAYALSI